MKRLSFSLSLGFLILWGGYAQGAHWARSYTRDWVDLRSNVVQKTSDDGVIVGGHVDKVWALNWMMPNQFLITKLDASGMILWQKVYPMNHGADLRGVTCIQEVMDGYIVAGYVLNIKTAIQATLVVKIGHSGRLLWQQIVGGSKYNTFPSSMLVSEDELVVIAGQISPIKVKAVQKRDFWVLALRASDGALIWQKAYDHSFDEGAVSIAPSTEQGFIVAGNFDKPGLDHGIWIIELDGKGKLLQNKNFDNMYGDELVNCIIKAKDDTYYLTGSIGPGKIVPFEILVVKFTMSPKLPYSWAKSYWVPASQAYGYPPGPKAPTPTPTGEQSVPPPTYGLPPTPYGDSICEMQDKTYVVAGSCTAGWGLTFKGIMGPPTPEPLQDGLLLKLHRDGQEIWCKLYGGWRKEKFYCVKGTATDTGKGDILVCGYNESFPTPSLAGEKGWVMNLRHDGLTGGDLSCMVRHVDILKSTPKLDLPTWDVSMPPIEAVQKRIRSSDDKYQSSTILLCDQLP